MANGGAKKILDDLDHPIMFVLAITLAVCATKALIHWGLLAAQMPGSAKLFD